MGDTQIAPHDNMLSPPAAVRHPSHRRIPSQLPRYCRSPDGTKLPGDCTPSPGVGEKRSGLLRGNRVRSGGALPGTTGTGAAG